MSLCLRRALPGVSLWRALSRQVLTRHSTSHTTYIKSLDSTVRLHESLSTPEATHSFVGGLTRAERSLLLGELNRVNQKEEEQSKVNGNGKGLLPSARCRLDLAIVNAVPFIGFGFLDNAIMIVAGESIELTLGAVFAISTMAAAAMGNLISDLAGIGLAGGVEGAAAKLGLPNPVLSAEQLIMPAVRRVIYAGRAVGLCVGCILGMFPLLFIGREKPTDDAPQS